MNDEIREARTCEKCGSYYPGDCFTYGCMDPYCKCDGCVCMRDIEEDIALGLDEYN